MGQAVEQCGRHIGVFEVAGRFTEDQVRGDDDVGPFVEFAEQRNA